MYTVVNPVITHAEGKIVWEEGCLSVPDFTAEVERAAQITLEGSDLGGTELRR